MRGFILFYCFTVFIILQSGIVDCIRCYSCSSNKDGIEMCTSKYQNSTVNSKNDFYCYESVIFSIETGQILAVDRDLKTITECGFQLGCQSEMLTGGVKRTQCCCAFTDLCNNLIAEPSQCYVCDNQQTSKCDSPSPQYCRRPRLLSSTNKFTCQTAEPNERCFAKQVAIGGQQKYSPVERGVRKFSSPPDQYGCVTQNSTAGTLVTTCICSGKLCNGN